ncbi:MAG: secretin N-terminal domain-containing protein [Steroidobacteraceae bacterium]
MKLIIAACATAGLAVALSAGAAMAADSTSANASASADAGIPIERIIAAVAHKTGKRYLVDPRVHANIQLIGQDPSNITYSDLLTILQVYGFAATEGGGYVRVIPDASIRQWALPQLSSGQTYPDAQFVNYVLPVKTVPAAHLVPILRPLLPPVAQLAADICSNSLLIADSYANVRKIETLVRALDAGTAPYQPEKCEAQSAAARHE